MSRGERFSQRSAAVGERLGHPPTWRLISTRLRRAMTHDANSIEARNKQIVQAGFDKWAAGTGSRREAAEISIGCLSSFTFSELR